MTFQPRAQPVLLSMLLLLGSSPLPAEQMSRDDYRAAKARIEAEFRQAEAACDRLSENLRDVCREDAKSKQKVGNAELEYNRSGSPADARKLALTRADGAYAVAKEKCDHRPGADKTSCLKEAKAAHERAVGEARAEARPL